MKQTHINLKTGEVFVEDDPNWKPEPLDGKVRAQRNQILIASDWTQIDDAPVDKAAWATYRQELRDIPEQLGFPEDVIWPTPPE